MRNLSYFTKSIIVLIGGSTLILSALLIIGVNTNEPDLTSQSYLEKISQKVSAYRNPTVTLMYANYFGVGMAAACKYDEQRIAKILTLSDATLKVLAGKTAEAEKLANDMLYMGAHRQKAGLQGSCSNVEGLLSKMEKWFADQGL